MAYEFITTRTEGEKVGIITLNRPKQLNALSPQLMVELGQALKAFDADAAIGCIVITGNEKAFAAGADIGAMATYTFADVYGDDYITRDWETIRSIRKPVIAAVSGFALGGGCELAMCCDFRVAGDNAKLGQPEILLGIIPGAGGTQRLPRLVGLSRAKDLILSGRFIGAEEAHAIGLVDRVVAPESVYDEAMAWARQLAKGPRLAMQAAKAAIARGMETDIEDGLEIERVHFASLFGTRDREIGMRTFIEKGPGQAEFTGS